MKQVSTRFYLTAWFLITLFFTLALPDVSVLLLALAAALIMLMAYCVQNLNELI